MKLKYDHKPELHGLTAPLEIVPLLVDIFAPKSVVDVGCGLGAFLKVFKDCGVDDVLGIDGSWCSRDLLFRNIKPEEFIETDLEKKISIGKKFDMVICLEVAEHLSPERADGFVRDLTLLGDVVLFSAAIPRQGGFNHINEQWLDYWEARFENNGFVIHDVLRANFWDNSKLFSYYKQNMVLATKKERPLEQDKRLVRNYIKNVVHPGLFLRLTDPKDGDAVIHFAKLLIKAIKYRVFGS
jgi:SAM-dependent methyltransferase